MTARLRSLARFAAPGFCFFWALSCSQSASVATVNGHAISRAELERQVRVYLSVRTGQSDGPETRRQVLDQLIKQRLLVQAAREAGLDKDPGRQQQVQARQRDLRQELERSIADLQAQLQSLDEAVETKALIDAYSQARRGGITITAKDLQAAYDLRKGREALPPLMSIRDQLLEQVILDRLVEQAQKKASVTIDAQNLL